MSVSHGLVASETASKTDATAVLPVVSWPLAVAVIGAGSVGLWVVVFRMFRLLLAY
jgi:hypothetical protein